MKQGSSFPQSATQLDGSDFFTITDLTNHVFDRNAHWHTCFELTMVMGVQGRRTVGDSCESFRDVDVVLVGPCLPHEWTYESGGDNRVICMHFHDRENYQAILDKRVFAAMRELFDHADLGVSFGDEAKPEISRRMLELTGAQGFDAVLQFISLIDFLARTSNRKILARTGYELEKPACASTGGREALVFDYIARHYDQDVRLRDVALLTGMSESAFCHFFKKKTGMNFVDYLNDVRVGHAVRMLYETDDSIANICRACGFNNTSNFIRVFKGRREITPSQYRSMVREMVTKY